MRKTLKTIATIALLLVFTSAYNGYDVNVNIDSFAPNFEIANAEKQTKLSDKRGNYVLVNFWSSSNASSRIRNIQYDRFFKSGNSRADFISVNFDNSEKLYKEILKVDQLASESQFHDDGGRNSEVYKDYHLESGFNSFLLNKEGKIVAINPTNQQLTEIFCQ